MPVSLGSKKISGSCLQRLTTTQRIALFGLGMLICLGGCKKEQTTDKQVEQKLNTHLKSGADTTKVDTKASLTVSVVDLLASYAKDEVKANAIYQNKRVTLTGKLTRLDVDMMERPVAIFEPKADQMALNCYLTKSAHEALTKNKPEGKTITLEGTVEGLSLHLEVRACARPAKKEGTP